MEEGRVSRVATASGKRPLSVEEPLRVHRIPQDDESVIWRYMRTKYFIDLLQSRAMYFRRLDRLQDQFEGAVSDDEFEAIALELAELARERGIEMPAGVDMEDAARLAAADGEALDRASVYVNCWHWSDYESWAMWHLFAHDNVTGDKGVAIRSTKGRLWDAVNPDQAKPRAILGDVGYYDRRTEPMPCLLPWLCKDQMFSWEREVRAWIPAPPRRYGPLRNYDDHLPGKQLSVNPETLIEAIVVPPGTREVDRARVCQLLAEFGLPLVPVLKSAADEIPFYRGSREHNRQVLEARGVELPEHDTRPEQPE
jgi:hypothetical protein